MNRSIARPEPTRRSFATIVLKSCAALSLLSSPVFAQSGGMGDTTPTTSTGVKPAETKVGITFPDRDKAYARNIKDFTKVQNERNSKDEYDTYNALIRHAQNFTYDQLSTAARKDVNYFDLIQKESDFLDTYRYNVIQFTGYLRSLKKFEANVELRDIGITHLYEAWIFIRKNPNPIVVVLIDPPAGIEPEDEIKNAKLVTVAGYYFKTIEYQTRETASKEGQGKFRPAPMFMARSLSVDATTNNSDIWGEFFIPGTLTIGGLLAVFILGGALYYRMGDKRAKTVLKNKMDNPFDTPSDVVYNESINPGHPSSPPHSQP